MTRTFKSREAWLNEFTKRARPVFKRAGFPIPEKVRVSVGFTSHGARGKRIGECWDHSCSEDATFEIFITPLIGDASRIADIHTHELIHAAVGLECGHKGPFVKCMKAVGLDGKPTATVAGPNWHAWADRIVASLGPLPHAELRAGANGQKKQTTRMIKCACPECGLIMRTTAQWIEATGGDMQCPDKNCGATLDIG